MLTRVVDYVESVKLQLSVVITNVMRDVWSYVSKHLTNRIKVAQNVSGNNVAMHPEIG